ncbi:MAG: Asp-tRNA(Asn)/Glu-tRNA(Gln) amidotransferase GatCAB subunit B, partial [Ignavibacteria bacterium]
ITEFNVNEKNLASLINLIAEGKISNNIAKEVFAEMLNSPRNDDEKQNPEVIVKVKNLLQVTDTSEIESIVKKVIEENPNEVKRYKEGETKLLGLFVGKVMKESKGKANPKAVNELLISNLG